jgi:hypothetical protein
VHRGEGVRLRNKWLVLDILRRNDNDKIRDYPILQADVQKWSICDKRLGTHGADVQPHSENRMRHKTF